MSGCRFQKAEPFVALRRERNALGAFLWAKTFLLRLFRQKKGRRWVLHDFRQRVDEQPFRLAALRQSTSPLFPIRLYREKKGRLNVAVKYFFIGGAVYI